MRSVRLHVLMFATTCVLACTGCYHTITVAAPHLSQAPMIPTPPASQINVLFKGSIAALAPMIEAKFPSNYDQDWQCASLLCFKGSVAADPVLLGVFGDQVRIHDQLYYEARANVLGVSGTCGVPDNAKRKATIDISGTVSWKPDWTLGITNGNANAQESPGDACEMTDAKIDETSKVIAAFNRIIKPLPDVANAALSTSDFLKREAQETWTSIQQPLSGGSGTTIMVNPDHFVVSQLAGNGELLALNTALIANPIVYVNSPAPSPGTAPLPPLQTGVIPDKFILQPYVVKPISDTSLALTQLVSGRIMIQHRRFLPNRKTWITSTTLSAAGGQVLMGIQLAGYLRGTAWINGTLAYDDRTRFSTFQGLSLAPESKAKLRHASPVLADKLLNETVIPSSSMYSQDIGSSADLLTAGATSASNQQINPSISLTARFGQPRIGGPFTVGDKYVYPVTLTGSATALISIPGEAVPTGREIRLVAVHFFDDGDDKDAEEPIDLWVDLGQTGGHPLAHRVVGTSERWGDHEDEGPYFLRLTESPVTDCGQISLSIHKQPAGSPTGKGWKMHMIADIVRADGSQSHAGHLDTRQVGDGEDHPFNLRVPLCDAGNQ